MIPDEYVWINVRKDDAFYPAVVYDRTVYMPFPNELVRFKVDEPPEGYVVYSRFNPPTVRTLYQTDTGKGSDSKPVATDKRDEDYEGWFEGGPF